MKKRLPILSFLTNPYILSLLLLIPFFFIHLIKFEKYKAEITKIENSLPTRFIYFEDLDNDGNSEEIWATVGGNSRVSISVYSLRKTIDQWNFNGVVEGPDHVFFRDIDKDGSNEIILFTYFSDSLYLNIFNPFSSKILCENICVTEIKKSYEMTDFSILFSDILDSDQDGLNEIYFSINAGFSKYPRQFYCFDISQNKLKISPTGCHFVGEFEKVDIEQDNQFEFYATSSRAHGNCTKDTVFSDWYTWLMVFNPDLTFKFKPIQMGYYPGTLIVQSFETNDSLYFACLVINQSLDNEYSSIIALVNSKGELVNKRNIDEYITLEFIPKLVSSLSDPKNLFVIFENKSFRIDNNLSLHEIAHIRIHSNNPLFKRDLDNDNIIEYVFQGRFEDEIIISSNDLRFITFLKLPERSNYSGFSVIKKNNKVTGLFFSGSKNCYTISYSKNPLYAFRFTYYPLIYLLILSIVLLISKTQ